MPRQRNRSSSTPSTGQAIPPPLLRSAAIVERDGQVARVTGEPTSGPAVSDDEYLWAEVRKTGRETREEPRAQAGPSRGGVPVSRDAGP